MARIAEEAILHEIKRSLRPDWRRFWKTGHENDRLYKLYERAERKFILTSRACRKDSRKEGSGRAMVKATLSLCRWSRRAVSLMAMRSTSRLF